MIQLYGVFRVEDFDLGHLSEEEFRLRPQLIYVFVIELILALVVELNIVQHETWKVNLFVTVYILLQTKGLQKNF